MTRKPYSIYITYALASAMVLTLWGCGLGNESPDSMKAPANTATSLNTQAAAQQTTAKTQVKHISEADKTQSQRLSTEGLDKAFAGEKEAGLSLVKEAYALDPTNVANYYNMAMVYKLRGELDESKSWFEQVLAYDPYNTWSIYGIATIYADQGKDQEALDWLEKAIALDPSVKSVAAEQDHFGRFHKNPRFERLVQHSM